MRFGLFHYDGRDIIRLSTVFTSSYNLKNGQKDLETALLFQTWGTKLLGDELQIIVCSHWRNVSSIWFLF